MILTIFLIFLGISIFFISLGYATGETAYALAGFSFMFIISATVLVPGALDYKTGEQLNETYFYDNLTLNSTSSLTVPVYDSFSNTLLSIILSFLSVAGLTISWFEWKKGRSED